MNNLPAQKDLIRSLREAYVSRGLTLDKILAMMPEDERKLGRTTCQKLFNREDAENLNFRYNTIIILSELLLDDTPEVDRERLEYKKSVIEMQETKIAELEDKITFRTEIIKSLDQTIEHLRQQNAKLTEILNKLVERCENCAFKKEE